MTLHLKTDENLEKAILILEIICNSIFLLEMIMKIIAQGLIIGKDSYLKNPWNILEFLTTIAGLFLSHFFLLNIFKDFASFQVIRI